MDTEYHVVRNTFRASNGGGHMTNGIGLSAKELSDTIVSVRTRDLRTIFRESLTAKGQVLPQTLDHWRYL
ncbi:MAG: hypothetical protein WCQ69_03710 [Bacteroidales bacterium]|nr:hypothetical protein [Bacteroidales bacterium]MDD2264666.1 hypothetical protein [Bacteroidales bacterium]MDD2832232.1 hypothetical protein [Bacteroidales bacterium]MDD3209107.1 hypothetical protein [Bacteroidales bacterium]MDD3697885.1 hypothetical protein [Bacteroidales bacterium]